MFESLQAQMFFLSTNVRVGAGDHLACFLMGTGIVPQGGLKFTGHVHGEVKNEWS